MDQKWTIGKNKAMATPEMDGGAFTIPPRIPQYTRGFHGTVNPAVKNLGPMFDTIAEQEGLNENECASASNPPPPEAQSIQGVVQKRRELSPSPQKRSLPIRPIIYPFPSGIKQQIPPSAKTAQTWGISVPLKPTVVWPRLPTDQTHLIYFSPTPEQRKNLSPVPEDRPLILFSPTPEKPQVRSREATAPDVCEVPAEENVMPSETGIPNPEREFQFIEKDSCARGSPRPTFFTVSPFAQPAAQRIFAKKQTPIAINIPPGLAPGKALSPRVNLFDPKVIGEPIEPQFIQSKPTRGFNVYQDISTPVKPTDEVQAPTCSGSAIPLVDKFLLTGPPLHRETAFSPPLVERRIRRPRHLFDPILIGPPVRPEDIVKEPWKRFDYKEGMSTPFQGPAELWGRDTGASLSPISLVDHLLLTGPPLHRQTALSPHVTPEHIKKAQEYFLRKRQKLFPEHLQKLQTTELLEEGFVPSFRGAFPAYIANTLPPPRLPESVVPLMSTGAGSIQKPINLQPHPAIVPTEQQVNMVPLPPPAISRIPKRVSNASIASYIPGRCVPTGSTRIPRFRTFLTLQTVPERAEISAKSNIFDRLPPSRPLPLVEPAPVPSRKIVRASPYSYAHSQSMQPPSIGASGFSSDLYSRIPRYMSSRHSQPSGAQPQPLLRPEGSRIPTMSAASGISTGPRIPPEAIKAVRQELEKEMEDLAFTCVNRAANDLFNAFYS